MITQHFGYTTIIFANDNIHPKRMTFRLFTGFFFEQLSLQTTFWIVQFNIYVDGYVVLHLLSCFEQNLKYKVSRLVQY